MSDESDQTPGPTSEEQEAGEPRFKWEYREEFRINTKMREVIGLTKVVAETEIDRLRRKIEKLTYGS